MWSFDGWRRLGKRAAHSARPHEGPPAILFPLVDLNELDGGDRHERSYRSEGKQHIHIVILTSGSPR
jgi:hypothetical protein